ncbi:MAG: hypothetical protein E5Y00_22360 [Mesorhizobium sp.]|nr:MAG: hypothetical protein E5Y00_22360 [Mesorhizobium sp.]
MQKRLKNERKNSAEKSSNARRSAVSGWKQRKSGNAFAMRSQCYPEPEPIEKAKAFSKRAAAQKKSWETEIDEVLNA